VGTLAAGLTLLLAATAALGAGTATRAPGPGFGTGTAGGEGQPVVKVTTLADDGPGSLRAVLSAGNRRVVFDVPPDVMSRNEGVIALSTWIDVRGSHVTVDGTTAPPPGITLRGRGGLSMHGTHGVHDYVIRGLRIDGTRMPENTDCITLAYGAHHVVIDHVTLYSCTDGLMDITFRTHDVTAMWSYFIGGPRNVKNQLISYAAERISLHHNLYMESGDRLPQIKWHDDTDAVTDTTVDFRNNVVLVAKYGTWVRRYPPLTPNRLRVNIVANYYSRMGRFGLRIEDPTYLADNVSPHEDVEAAMRRRVRQAMPACAHPDREQLCAEQTGVLLVNAPFPAPDIGTEPACVAARRVLTQGGMRPLTPHEAEKLAAITLAGCP
jgi:hypothetical protein